MKHRWVCWALGVVFPTGLILGCSGGSSPDTAPTAPPVTAETSKSLTNDINAQKGGMKPAPR